MFSQGILFVCILIGTVWVAVESEEADLIFLMDLYIIAGGKMQVFIRIGA